GALNVVSGTAQSPVVVAAAQGTGGQGDLILQKMDANGTITVGSFVTLQSNSNSANGGGRGILSIGNGTNPPSATSVSVPAGLSLTTPAGGNAYLGTGLTVSGTNTANVSGGVLIVNNGGSASAITLSGNDAISVNGTAPQLSSLDLSSAAVVQQIYNY